MTELDLRALVREAVQRHLGQTPATAGAPASAHAPAATGPHAGRAGHPAQAVYLTLVNTTDDCVIEPSVRCNHCGYCKTHGY
jgi:hypothetical protein